MRSAWVAALLVLTGLMPAPAEGLEVLVYYPNLQTLRPYEIRIGSPDAGFHPPYAGVGAIRFDTGLVNPGYAALDLIAVPTAIDQATLLQCTSWQGDLCLNRVAIGVIPWHQGHDSHFHLTQLLVYELRRLGENGDVDFSPEGLVSAAGRSSTCLIDGGRVEVHEDFEHTVTNSTPYQYAGCRSFRARLSSGWLMLLHNHIFEQFVPADDVPDGDYAIVIRLNVDRMIVETKYNDNVSYRKIRLYDEGRRVDTLD